LVLFLLYFNVLFPSFACRLQDQLASHQGTGVTAASISKVVTRGKGKGTPAHAIMAYRGDKVQLHDPGVLTPEKEPHYPLKTNLSESCGENIAASHRNLSPIRWVNST
jgi:hypothetical protein